MTWAHSSGVKCSAFASSDQHGRADVFDQLVKAIYLLKSGDIRVDCFGGDWVELWVRHDGGLK